MIQVADLYAQTQSAVKNQDAAMMQEIFMTLPNKKKVMNEKNYESHIKDLFIFLTDMQKTDIDFYQQLLTIPLFDKINKEIIKDYSKFSSQIEKKFTQAVTFEYTQTVLNLASMIKNPDFLLLFKEKNHSSKWLNDLAGLPNQVIIKQILVDLSQGSNAFKLEKTGEYIGFLLGEATFAYQKYEQTPALQKKFKTRQSYLSHSMKENTMVVQFSYKDPTHRHACVFNKFTVEKTSELYKTKSEKIKEKSAIDALSVSTTRKTIIPFISISSRTMNDSLLTQSEQASRFLTHLHDETVKKQIIAKALHIKIEEVSQEEYSQWKIEPQILDIAPIDEWGKSRKGVKNSAILLGNASHKNLGEPAAEFDFDKINYRRELNHITYISTLFSGVINEGLEKRQEHGKSIDMIQANYWSIGVDTHEIYQIGECIKEASTRHKKYKLLHQYCTQKLALLLKGLGQAEKFYEVLPEGSLTKINQILTIYHALCGSHGASCSNPINKGNFSDYSSQDNVSTLYKMGKQLISWVENYPNGINTNLELFKDYKNLKSLVGQSEAQFKENMNEYSPKEFNILKQKKAKKV